MQPQTRRIIQPREAAPADSGGGWIGVGIFFVATLALFVYTLMLRGHGTAWFSVITGVFALVGVAGVGMKLYAESSLETFGTIPLEVDAPEPAVGGQLRATLRLPKSAAAASTVRAELLCYTVSTGDEQVERVLVWGKGASFAIRWRADEGEAVLVFQIPEGLPRSEAYEPGAPAQRKFAAWELNVKAETSGQPLDRSYDLNILPSADPARAAAAKPPELLRPLFGEAPAVTARPAPPPDWSAIAVLVAANLVLVVGVASWGWRVQEVVFLYWMENLVIGAWNVLRILCAVPAGLGLMARQGIGPSATGLFFAKLFSAAFFVLHFGLFCYVHGEFLAAMIDLSNGVRMPGFYPLGPVLAATLRDPHSLAAIAALAVSHGYSFFRNYLGRGEYRNVEMAALMKRPYQRIVVTHLFIMAGAAAMFALQSPLAVIIVFVVVKIAVDVYSHLSEHRALAAAAGPV